MAIEGFSPFSLMHWMRKKKSTPNRLAKDAFCKGTISSPGARVIMTLRVFEKFSNAVLSASAHLKVSARSKPVVHGRQGLS
jgi:hypothetical protein